MKSEAATAKTQSVTAEIKTLDGRASSGRFEVRELEQSERMMEAIKWLVIFWAVAGFCVLIPILHFVLVPGFLIVGPIIAMRVYKIDKRIVSGNAACPVCGKPVNFKEVSYRPSFKESCSHCANQLYVQF